MRSIIVGFTAFLLLSFLVVPTSQAQIGASIKDRFWTKDHGCRCETSKAYIGGSRTCEPCLPSPINACRQQLAKDLELCCRYFGNDPVRYRMYVCYAYERYNACLNGSIVSNARTMLSIDPPIVNPTPEICEDFLQVCLAQQNPNVAQCINDFFTCLRNVETEEPPPIPTVYSSTYHCEPVECSPQRPLRRCLDRIRIGSRWRCR